MNLRTSKNESETTSDKLIFINFSLLFCDQKYLFLHRQIAVFTRIIKMNYVNIRAIRNM